jgi:hypothetical protein
VTPITVTPITVSFSSKKFGKLVWYAVVCVALTAALREPRLLDSQPVIWSELGWAVGEGSALSESTQRWAGDKHNIVHRQAQLGNLRKSDDIKIINLEIFTFYA